LIGAFIADGALCAIATPQIYFIGDVERVLASPAYRERLKMGRPPRAKRDRRRRREHRKKGNGGLRRRLNT
jgi:hypothetical protein